MRNGVSSATKVMDHEFVIDTHALIWFLEGNLGRQLTYLNCESTVGRHLRDVQRGCPTGARG